MTDTYRTVAGRGRARFEVQGSEFVGRVAPADSVAAAEAFVEAIRAEYDDATHNVPVYRVPADEASAAQAPGEAMLREYSSDAGEPSGSAGKPALNVLQQRDVRNAVATVTRYYGGTNLGVGGLARAYARSVKLAVDDAGVIERRPRERFTLRVGYDDSGTVRGVLESAGADFEAEYAEAVTVEVSVAVEDAEALRERLLSATSGRVEIER